MTLTVTTCCNNLEVPSASQVDESVWDVCANPNGTTEAETGTGEAGLRGEPQYTTSGEACVFPATYMGNIIRDCVDIGGMPRCQARPICLCLERHNCILHACLPGTLQSQRSCNSVIRSVIQSIRIESCSSVDIPLNMVYLQTMCALLTGRERGLGHVRDVDCRRDHRFLRG